MDPQLIPDPKTREVVKGLLRRLEALERSSGGKGVTDHGALSGLSDDDHAQYLTTARHDSTERHGSNVVDHGNIGGLADDDHTQYHTDARGDARYYTKTDADAAFLGKLAKAADSNLLDGVDLTALAQLALANLFTDVQEVQAPVYAGLAVSSTALVPKARIGINSGTAALTLNAYYDGTNWQRDDTTKPSFALLFNISSTRFEFRYAAAGTGTISWSVLANLTNAGKLSLASGSNAPLNVPVLTANPSSPANGDLWITDISTVRKFNARIGGVTYSATLT